MPGSGHRSYTSAERAEAVGLSLSIGSKAAAARLGIPRRTISYWLAKGGDPVVARVIEASHADVADSLWRVVAAGTEEALRRIHDPKTRAGELAQLLKVAAEQHALLSGRVTSRTAVVDESEGITAEEADRLADWLEQRLFEGHDPDEILAAVRPQLPSGPSDVG